MKKFGLLLLFGGIGLAISIRTATALPQFNTEFKAKYIKEDGGSEAQKKLAEAYKEKKCNTCHGKNPDTGKDDKKVRNRYGKALDELLTKDDAKNKEKIQEALDTAYDMPSDPDDEDSPTFGELIEMGILPGEEEEEEGE
jgi:hypothetical protein